MLCLGGSETYLFDFGIMIKIEKGEFMQIVNFKDASVNLDAVFNTVYLDSEEVIMHKENGQKVVMIPFEEYSSMVETSYLFASPKNKEHLTASLKELRNGKGVQREIIE